MKSLTFTIHHGKKLIAYIVYEMDGRKSGYSPRIWNSR